MDSLTWLLCLCIAMFLGAFGSGYIPLIFSMSESKLRLITIFGAGLLVGTALIVIIPEGVAMHYEGQQKHQHLTSTLAKNTGNNNGEEGSNSFAIISAAHNHNSRSSSSHGSSSTAGTTTGGGDHHHRRLLLSSTPMDTAEATDYSLSSTTSSFVSLATSLLPSSSSSSSLLRPLRNLQSSSTETGGVTDKMSSPSNSIDTSNSHDNTVTAKNPLSTTSLIETTLATATLNEQHQTEADEITHQHPGHWEIGAALAIGFAFQLIIDRLSGGLHSHPQHSSSVVVTTPTASTSSSSSSVGNDNGSNGSTEKLNIRANNGGDHSAKSKSAMVGMVVHAIVDGVALGAAVREGDSTLGFIVFLAIMLHKAPSSFGLSSYLLHHGISHEGVKKRLLLFSSAAPFGAISTYTLLTINLFTYKQEMLARCLLFSGGTFLYVATAHVLPEIQNGHTMDTHDDKDVEDEEYGNTSSNNGHSHHHHHHHRTPPKMKWSEIWIMVGGVLLPLLIDVHHGH